MDRAGPPGIAQPEQLGGLVEGFAGGVVQGFPQRFVGADAGNLHQLAVAAGNQQGDEREGGRIGFEQRREQVAFEMVDADDRHLEREAQRGGNAGADQQRPGQPRPFGIGDGLDIVQGAAGLLQDLPGQRQHAPDVVARGEFRHHPAVFGVHRHLGVQRMGEQAALRMVQSNAGFIAGGFDSEDEHKPAIIAVLRAAVNLAMKKTI